VTRRTVGVFATAAAATLAGQAAGATTAGWPQPNGDLGGTRAVSSPITARTVAGLRVRWRYPLTRGSTFGTFASTPVVVGKTVYVQDLSSSVTAIDLRTGARRWQYLTQARILISATIPGKNNGAVQLRGVQPEHGGI